MGRINKTIEDITKQYIVDFVEKSQEKSLSSYICGNIPIVWFGDLLAYKTSKVKIVTIGLNPSDSEFPSDESRFDTSINCNKGLKDIDDLTVSLINDFNKYFDNNPYKEWFDEGFEKVLRPLKASYYKQSSKTEKINRALHIDVCSSIATKPTWSQLKTGMKKQLQNKELFQNLLKELNPDIIIACCDQNSFKDNFSTNYFSSSNRSDSDWIFKYEYIYKEKEYEKITERKRNTNTSQYIRVFLNKSDKTKFLVWGKTWNIPFGGFAKNEKFDFIFQNILTEHEKVKK